jgi:hypothetical protein
MNTDPSLAIIQPVPVRSRILEIALSVGFSSLFSIAAMLWALSGTLSEIKEKVSDHERRMQTAEVVYNRNTAMLSALSVREDGSDRFHADVQDRLRAMDEKLDRLLIRDGNRR